jgi:hypothetical protein
MERRVEQRVNVNFCVEGQKWPVETLEMLEIVYGKSSDKVKDQRIVDVLFGHQGYHPL